MSVRVICVFAAGSEGGSAHVGLQVVYEQNLLCEVEVAIPRTLANEKPLERRNACSVQEHMHNLHLEETHEHVMCVFVCHYNAFSDINFHVLCNIAVCESKKCKFSIQIVMLNMLL